MTGRSVEPTSGAHSVVAVLGLGEAGSRLAADLADQGVLVRGYDPVAPMTPKGVTRVDSVAAAVENVDVVLAVVPASAVVTVAVEASGAVAPGTIYADCAAGPVADKRVAAAHLRGARADFVDVAILGVVPATGLHTPSLLSGPGAHRLEPIFTRFGMPTQVVSGEPGAAAEHKLLRSVFMKGFAAAIGESLEAAERLGFEHWMREQIEEELRRADASLVERFQRGTRRHAARRVVEMTAALDLLRAEGLPAEITRATVARLTRLAETGSTATRGTNRADPSTSGSRSS